jgi:transcriptional regulator with XRE-family HTH domain
MFVAMGRLLREVRYLRDRTATDVAASLDVSLSSVTRIETGVRSSWFVLWFEICDELDIWPDVLLGVARRNVVELTGPCYPDFTPELLAYHSRLRDLARTVIADSAARGTRD